MSMVAVIKRDARCSLCCGYIITVMMPQHVSLQVALLETAHWALWTLVRLLSSVCEQVIVQILTSIDSLRDKATEWTAHTWAIARQAPQVQWISLRGHQQLGLSSAFPASTFSPASPSCCQHTVAVLKYKGQSIGVGRVNAREPLQPCWFEQLHS